MKSLNNPAPLSWPAGGNAWDISSELYGNSAEKLKVHVPLIPALQLQSKTEVRLIGEAFACIGWLYTCKVLSLHLSMMEGSYWRHSVNSKDVPLESAVMLASCMLRTNFVDF